MWVEVVVSKYWWVTNLGSDNTGYEETLGRLGVVNTNGELLTILCGETFNIGASVFPHGGKSSMWVSSFKKTGHQIYLY